MRRLESLAADSATLQTYLQEIAKFPRLAIEQERELGRRIQHQQDDSALDALVGGNLRFVVSYARRYRQLGVPLLHLIHEGNLGLLEAARHFDPDGDVKFIAHGVWWVRQSIMHRLAEAQVSALRAQVEHQAANGDNAEDFEITDEEAQILMHGLADNAPLTLLLRAADEMSTLDDFDDALHEQAVREVDDEATRDALVQELELALGELDPKERLVMRLRYGLYDDEVWTVEQIGERMRLGRAGVRRLESRAVQNLRRMQHLRGCLN
ncbi:MAG TPA: sigma-70 family RNA polymerase sigma factor [Vicinamibacterales bacterium]|nr:sigma-70 family RNA polymerase sigma factor [Vicinamibacterales bacterium]